MDYAGRMFYMIQRRTIRDLIVRAHSHYTAARRRAAYAEIVEHDNDIERHFKDVTQSTEPMSDCFVRFLSAAEFSNGFKTMQRLDIANRIKWMKICAVMWHAAGRETSCFRFKSDHEQAGIELDRCLQAMDEAQLNKYLGQIDAGNSLDSFADIGRIDGQYSLFGIRFCPGKDGILEINN